MHERRWLEKSRRRFALSGSVTKDGSRKPRPVVKCGPHELRLACVAAVASQKADHREPPCMRTTPVY